MMIRDRRFLGLVAAALLSLGNNSPASALDAFTVRDSWSVSGLQAGWYWAMNKGLFAKHGVSVALEDGNGSGVTVQLVNSGKFDVGHADLSVMAVARGKGMNLISIGGLIQKTSIGVFVPKDSGIKTAKDLEGKEVIYTATSFEGPFIDPFLKAGGTNRDKINLMSVDAAAKIPSYAAGKGDAMIVSIPFGMAYVQKTRPSNYILFGDYGLDLPSYGLVVTQDTLEKRGTGLKGLADAYFEAWQQIIDGGESSAEEAASILMKARPDAKLDREQLLISIREHIKYFHTPNTASKPLGYQSAEDWKRVIELMENAALIPAGSKPDDYFTNKLIDGAK
ncbi:ABC transporter substrate-binding protein [Bradyrhizobium canariense]|uniref:NitT/TauT family transport system substrate-binding protein n=1 Tax=Bradyrhizobium canariense TaxID=255045 RepID=A0A1H1SK75_9BRAD|nr:ABC transporter substrate-binding protein [Bradyrhizobium canariense]SDS48352.1 NitT/TauT family transport system substrate-binding protein [Bradyrhizobium canariense]